MTKKSSLVSIRAGWLRGEIWDGTSWTALPFSLPPSLDNTAQNFDVAYESQSGNAIVVWDNLSGGTASVSYRVWDGTSWSAEATITAPDAGIATEMRLAASPNSNEMVLIVSDDNSDEWAAVWDGSTWGNTVLLDTTITGNRTEIAVAFESQSGHAMVVYDVSNNYNDLNYQTWNGTAWSGPLTLNLPNNGLAETDARFTTIAADPTSDRIAIGVVTTGTENQVVFAVWDGTAWGNMLMATNSSYTGSSPLVAVGFESQSGDLLVTYGEAATTPRYQTWSSGGGWSGELSMPNIGAFATVMTMASDPLTDAQMLAIQDSDSDLHYILWDGAAWGTDNELSTNTGETNLLRPFTFVFDAAPPAVTFDITGTIYEDVDGDGDVLDDGNFVTNVDVLIYLDDGDGVIDAGDGYVTTVSTDMSGNYSFSGLANGTYWVVVDSKTIDPSAGYNSGFSELDVWAEQTYGTAGAVSYNGSYSYLGAAGSLYGGMRGEVSDDATALASAEHVTRAVVAGANVTGIDSGFSFNAVTRTGDGDDDLSNNRSVQGSLRQFIQNSNAIVGTQSSQFAISTSDSGYNGSGNGEYTIQVIAAGLPYITDTIILDGTTQSGFVDKPIIELDGTATATGEHGLRLAAGSDASTLRGFVINRFDGNGIDVLASDGNTIEGNFIGTDVSGTNDLGNTGKGIRITNIAANNVIGGATASARNLISGNDGDGIRITVGSLNNQVLGNYIGTDLTGTAELGNSGYGVLINSSAVSNTIGGTTAGAGNLISGNLTKGIGISGLGTDGNVVQGNYVGTDVTGTVDLGNVGTGIWLANSAAGNTIGGTAAGAGNLVAFSGAHGIDILDTAGAGNAVRGNRVFSNSGLGIDLNNDDIPTANDDLDADNLQNYPILTSANTDTTNGIVFVAGRIESTPSTTFFIDFFANSTIDPSGYGEGETYLGEALVVTDANGIGYFDGLYVAAVPVGGWITATATDSSGNTSEFSLNIQADDMGTLTVDTTSDVADGNTSSITNLLVDRGADERISLREAIKAANNTANAGSPDEIHFNISASDTGYVDPDAIPGNGDEYWSIALGLTALDQINDAVIIDGTTQPTFAGMPVIEIDGSGVASNDGFHLTGGSDGSTIRGLVINGFDTDGIDINGSDGNTIQGNYIGTNVAGNATAGNTSTGIIIRAGAQNNTIGGSGAGQGNLIGGNGIGISISAAADNTIVGNIIGTDLSGTIDLGNGIAGIRISGVGSNDNTIGGVAAGEGNVIAFNDNDGLQLQNGSGTGNSMLGNSIYSNSQLGIDLHISGRDLNDPGDGDTGANNRQNYPLITNAVTNGVGTIQLIGSLDTNGLFQDYRIEFFASTTADATGYGEAERFLGYVTATTDGSGDATFDTAISAVVAVGESITATATVDNGGGDYGDTSEFALNVSAADLGYSPIAVWNELGSSQPQYNSYDSGSFGSEGLTANLGQWRIIQGAEAPTRDEAIVVGVNSSGQLDGQIWNGVSWNALPINPLGTVTQTYWWGMDVAYESDSGDAVLVWTDGANIEYATWDGSSWSAVNTLGIYSGATPRQLQLAASPDSDEMVLVVSDSNSHDRAFVWDGDNWGNAVTLATNSGDDRTDINVAYEQQSGDAMVVYGDNTLGLRYQTWDGVSWSGQNTITAPGGVSGDPRWTTIASDPNSDRIAVGVVTFNNEAWFAVWDGSSWGDQILAEPTTHGSTFPNAAVAFESNSGDLLATYAEGTKDDLRYQTWSSGGGWSGELKTPDKFGDALNSMTLSSDPMSNKIMLALQDDGSDLNYVLWNGSSWGTPSEQETDTGEIKNQPFLFLWDQQDSDTAVLTSVQDTYIKLGETGNNFGVSTEMIVDRESGDLQRALVQFDLSGIPVGAIIYGATLNVEATAVDGLLNIGVYQVA